MTEKEFILEFVKRYQEYQKKAAAINTFDHDGRMEHEGLKIDLLLFCIEYEETILEVDGRSVAVGLEIASFLANSLRKQANGIVEIIARSWKLLIENWSPCMVCLVLSRRIRFMLSCEL